MVKCCGNWQNLFKQYSHIIILMERKICEECGGKIVKKKVKYLFLGENLGQFPAEVCTECNEEVFDETVTKKISEIAKEKGIFGVSKS